MDKYQALREAISEFDDAAQEYGWESDQGTRTRFARVKTKYEASKSEVDAAIRALLAEREALRIALQDCVTVMENELNGLAVIRMELKQAKIVLDQ